MNTKSNRIETESDETPCDSEVTEPAGSADIREDCTEAVDYVNQLIARMNGVDELPTKYPQPNSMVTEPIMPPPGPTIPQASAADSMATSQPENKGPSSETQSEASSVLEPNQPNQPNQPDRRRQPERRRQPQRPVVMAADMQRLREAANISASGVLNSFESRNLYRAIYLYLLLAAGLILASILLVGMSDSVSSTSYYASVIATLVAMLASWKYLRLTSRLVYVLKHQGSHSLPDIPDL